MKEEIISLFTPIELLCEYFKRPLMIDKPNPRFSWRLPETGTHGVKQTGYRIEVVKDLPDGSYDLEAAERIWDSGCIRAETPFGVIYTGKPLEPFSAYRWRVQVWTIAEQDYSDEQESGFSDWAVFETAAFSAADITARWISHPKPEPYYEGEWECGVPKETSSREESLHYMAFYCSRRYSLSHPQHIVRARALVCGLGVCKFYIDGEPIGNDLLHPPQTDFRKRALYTVYDLTDMFRKHPEPLVTLMLGNGRHIALYGFGKPRGIVQIWIEYDDGTRTTYNSDESWSIQPGPVRENSIFNGEHYDARIAAPWNRTETADDMESESTAVDSSDTFPAEIVPGPSINAALIPPVRIDRRVPCRNFWKSKNGYIFDMGQNFSGIADISVEVPSGTTLILRYGELIHPDGSLNPASNRAAKAEDHYIAANGKHIWHPITTYHGFRYIELIGYPGEPTKETVCGLFIHTAVEYTSSFSCSHPLLRQIHRNIIWGQLSNLMGIPTDSPQRDERHGWLGDALLSAEECLLNFYPVTFYEKFLQDIADTQNSDGSITDVAPKFWMDKPADPAWGSAFISIGWYLYWYTGDNTVLKRYYSAYCHYIEFLMGRRSPASGLIESLGTFGDWCAPGLVVPKKTGLSFTSTWYAQHDIELMTKIARLLGFLQDADRFESLHNELVKAINRAFLKRDRYETLPLSPWDFPDQTAQTLALSSNIVPDDVRSSVASTLDMVVTAEFGDHVGTGIHGTRYLLTALTDHGYAEKAFTIATQESYPGWGYMIKEGATTLWERWENIEARGMNSHNHIMFGSIAVWLYTSVAGLAPAAAGWKNIAFRPGRFLRISEASALCTTPYGRAGISWKRHDHKDKPSSLDIDLHIPPGCEGVLYLHDACEGCLDSTDRETPLIQPDTWRLWDRDKDSPVAAVSDTRAPIRFPSGEYHMTLSVHQN